MRYISIFFIMIFSLSSLHGDNFVSTEKFDAFVVEMMEHYHVPGLSLAVIKDGEIETLKGYGHVEIGYREQITPDTVFAVGSCSKAIAAASLGALVDEGLIDWDTSIQQLLPNFEVADSKLSKKITIADILSHRTGLDASNYLWYGTSFTRPELLAKLKWVKAVEPFRDCWVYNNLLYMAAGEIVPRLKGISWDDFVLKKLFRPLKMYNSGTTFSDFYKANSVAMPHVNTPSGVRSFPHRNVDSIGPAGSIVSSAADMAQWVKMLQNKGKYGGQRILSEKVVSDLMTPFAKIKDQGFKQYGLGWALEDYQGYTLVSHNGYLDGTTARVAMIPEQGIGVVILANLHCSPISQVVTNTILDAYLERDFHDWSLDFPDNVPENKVLSTTYKNKDDLLNYAARYYSDIYGEAFILWDNGRLKYKFHAFEGELIPIGKKRFAFAPSYEYVYAPIKELQFSDEGFEDISLGTKFKKIYNEEVWYGYWGWEYPFVIDSL